MLGTLTQANGFTSNINRCIEWSEVLSAFNQSALDEEFFAWQDQQEQARLDAIMDQPVDYYDLYTEADYYEYANLGASYTNEWEDLVDDRYDHLIVDDDLAQQVQVVPLHIQAKSWSEQDLDDFFQSQPVSVDISDYQIMLVDKICKISNCYEVEFVQSLYLLEAQELHNLIDQYNKPPKGYCYIGVLRASTDKACFITETGADDSLGLWYPKKLSWQMPRTDMMYIPVWLLVKRTKEREMNTPRVWQA